MNRELFHMHRKMLLIAASIAVILLTTISCSREAPAASLSADDCQSEGLPNTACTGVDNNADWTPTIRAFNDVEMALVPAGCFQMGSEDGDSDESPVHEVCFEEPFWIDVYEVTNEQMGGAARRQRILETLLSASPTGRVDAVLRPCSVQPGTFTT